MCARVRVRVRVVFRFGRPLSLVGGGGGGGGSGPGQDLPSLPVRIGEIAATAGARPLIRILFPLPACLLAWLDLQVELHDVLQEMHVLATAPSLFGVVYATGVLDSLGQVGDGVT